MKKPTRNLVLRGEVIRRLALVDLASAVVGGAESQGDCTNVHLALQAVGAVAVAKTPLTS
jgi:hypothetical protein